MMANFMKSSGLLLLGGGLGSVLTIFVLRHKLGLAKQTQNIDSGQQTMAMMPPSFTPQYQTQSNWIPPNINIPSMPNPAPGVGIPPATDAEQKPAFQLVR